MGSYKKCQNLKKNVLNILIFTFTNFLFSNLNNSLLHFILSWSTSVENSLAGKNYDFAIVLMLLTVTSKVTPFSFKRLTKDVSLNAYPGVKTPVNNKKNRHNRNLGWVRKKCRQKTFPEMKWINFTEFREIRSEDKIFFSCEIDSFYFIFRENNIPPDPGILSDSLSITRADWTRHSQVDP